MSELLAALLDNDLCREIVDEEEGPAIVVVVICFNVSVSMAGHRNDGGSASCSTPKPPEDLLKPSRSAHRPASAALLGPPSIPVSPTAL